MNLTVGMSAMDLFRKGSHWYPNSVMGILEVNEFTVGMMKSVEKIKQLSGRFITASRGRTILFSVFPGHFPSVGLCSTMDVIWQFKLEF